MFEQGTDEWLAERAGKVTASRISDLMAKTKTGVSASRANYGAQLIAERLTGTPASSFSNTAMQWGTDTEPQARAMYALTSGDEVEETGFHHHPEIDMSGASPDGLVAADGLVEIKCPNTATHISTLRGAGIDKKYLLQMQWQMACTDRVWCDFVSFDPRLPDSMQMFVKRIMRDEPLLFEIEEAVKVFLGEIDEAVADLRSRYEEKI